VTSLKLHSRMPAVDRFEASYTPEPNSGCWLWLATAYPYPSGDRPYLVVDGRRVLANRFAYRTFKGPTGAAWVLHTCHNSFCVNPDHLYLGTPKQNTQDMLLAGRHFSQRDPDLARAKAARLNAFRRAMTHCKRGHPLSGDNLLVDPRGYRSCKACSAISRKRRRAHAATTQTGK
jgi:hypothetical protein